MCGKGSAFPKTWNTSLEARPRFRRRSLQPIVFDDPVRQSLTAHQAAKPRENAVRPAHSKFCFGRYLTPKAQRVIQSFEFFYKASS